jgi:hypothetical protein
MSDLEFSGDLRGLPEIAAREFYIHQVVSKSPASVLFDEFTQRQKEEERRREGITGVEFRFAGVVYFMAQTAAAGVIGNLSYKAMGALVRTVRKPKEEFSPSGITFEVVVSRKTYDALRKKRHRGKRANRSSSAVKTELTKTYSLMVTMRDAVGRPRKRR